MPIIIPKNIEKLIAKKSPKFLRKSFEEDTRKRFERIKSEMIMEFLAHPITKEIMAGPTSSNISNTLGGNGNLFSFIGFEKGDDPIKPILDFFQSINISFQKPIDSGIQFSVNFPESREIFELTPMPWAEGRSWVKGIETGISGLGYYLFQKNNISRSGEGMQTKTKLNKGFSFKNTSYISALLNKYRKQIQQLK